MITITLAHYSTQLSRWQMERKMIPLQRLLISRTSPSPFSGTYNKFSFQLLCWTSWLLLSISSTKKLSLSQKSLSTNKWLSLIKRNLSTSIQKRILTRVDKHSFFKIVKLKETKEKSGKEWQRKSRVLWSKKWTKFFLKSKI